MKKLLIALLLNALAINSYAADSYTVDSRHTFPSFEINHLGFSTQRGRFNQTSGTILLNKNSVEGGEINITIETNSIDTGLAELEEHLRGEDFLSANRFKQIQFRSTKLYYSGDQLTRVDGNLNLHGISKAVQLTVDAFHCGINPIKLKTVCGANATTTIKRSDFAIDKYLPMISDEVKIMIQIEAIKD